ncbi:hypothetical protein D9611_003660 [Ephemerocybe angulata]|uniref:Kri1-like C-terminal domain-containing protein n=1 Tax=Ephemerocybe angulata TaxID=980116 RepID=A0A8H5B5W4_9AGAR|nr:hypothetical protein D9611_003660 [Tulosesus angulatus]
MFSDSSGDEDDQNVKLTINEHYAKAFEYRKEREELEKLKEKYGSDFNESDLDESTDSESAESEDEEGEELTPAVDAAILRTLARIRKRDPAIYDSEKNIFGEEKEKVSEAPAPLKAKKQEKSKPITLRQQNIDAVLHGSRSPSPEPQPTHVQEQEALRSETIRAFHSAVAASDDEDDILVLREKTKDEVEREEEEYRAYLERQVGEDLRGLVTVGEEGDEGDDEEEEGEKKERKKKKKKGKKEREGKGKSKADEDQEFLLNYILNRGWIDAASQRVPTYHEITGDAKKKSKSKGKSKVTPASPSASEDDDENDPALLSDASFDSLASQFETSYNHRFEEPDAAVIPSFPRQIESTVRREENPRKEARERKKARKEQEMEKKREEVRRLKALKVKEIRRRLERIGVESGLVKGGKKEGGEGGVDVDGALQELDLEGEWDPEKHDRQLKELFAEEEEGEGGVEEDVRYDEDGKPVWDDEVDLGGIYVSEDEDEEVVERKSKKEKKKEKKLKKKKKDKGGEDEGEGVDVDAMDADVVGLGGEDDEEWDGTEEMRQRKWKEYMDSLYELDFNDIVGDMPTRFKYVPVSQVNYSLDPVDILMATDKELNEYMSVKKYAPYRHERGDRSKWDPKQQEKLRELKESLKKRQMAFGNYDANGARGGSGANGSRVGSGKRGAEGAEEEGGEKPKKKRMGKKERLRLKAEEEAGGGAGGAGEPMEVEPVAGEEKKKKRKREEDAEVPVPVPEAESAAPTEEGTKKKKRKRKHKKAEGAAGDA